ncbi:hypothetical protein F4778DRAFT_531514 [Xylariomycetidae sp. FL2044]|nr:hypothetical protein F4778DRAFT_531514 [Xylariomycetidae sp. FL2044]
MAPARGPGTRDAEVHQIDRTPEYNDFIQKLTAFHEKRGTSFEPEPRLPVVNGHVQVDLLKVYKAVIARGGYDQMNTVQKSWGVLAADLGMHASDTKNIGQLSFQLKQDFYRYLAAYWIQDQYGKEPPPKEILEQQSCATKHGAILNRTVENFIIRQATDTPTKEDRPTDSTPVSGNRASGRLREAPPQRVPFQPETGPSRQSNRHSSSQHATPTGGAVHHNHVPHNQHTHHMPPHHNPNNPLHILQAQQNALRGASVSFTPTDPERASKLGDLYEPRPPITVPLRPVNTPGNNPVEYAKRQRQLRMQAAGIPDVPFRPLPGTGIEGPNIYTRCLQALRSGIPAEQAFALNHLVKISFERGDKYKFESFLGLAEGLIEKGLEIGSHFYHVDWQISYQAERDSSDLGVLDGLHGTHDILDRISNLKPKSILEHLQPADFKDHVERITEAVLTIRNMMMLPDNAIYMADVCPLKDLLCIILCLPNLESVVEIKHFALDIAEQLTPWLILGSDDPLYRTLLSQLDSTDRGTILTSMRAISRVSMNHDATNQLQNVSPAILRSIMDWLLLNDEELMDACLDFLYQYTAVVGNVETLLRSVDMEHVVPHLVRLLAHGAKRVKEDRVLEPEQKAPCSEEVCSLPLDLQEKLTSTDEPQRCFQWLQSLFEEDPDSHITQIAIWQAYQSSFIPMANGPAGAPIVGPRNMLSAADFIRNVTHVFANARAQIIRDPSKAQLFIIEGIRARVAPLNYETKEEYARCQWLSSKGSAFEKKCNQFFLSGEKLWYHILTAHLGASIGEDKSVKNVDITTGCDWSGCLRYPKPELMKLVQIAQHVRTHTCARSMDRKRSIVDTASGMESTRNSKRPRKSYITPAKTMSLSWEQTMVTQDERNPRIELAAGIPLSAVLVLRNVARNVVKTESEEALLKQHEMGGEGGGWNEKLFRPVLPRLFEVMTENKALAGHVTSLLQLVQDDN